MGETVLTYLSSIVFCWNSLFLTARILGKTQSEWEGDPASPKDDALAALMIVVLTLAAHAVSYFLLGSIPIAFLVYWGLIYFAFQMNNLSDALVFYIIHWVVTTTLSWLGVVPLFMLSQAGS